MFTAWVEISKGYQGDGYLHLVVEIDCFEPPYQKNRKAHEFRVKLNKALYLTVSPIPDVRLGEGKQKAPSSLHIPNHETNHLPHPWTVLTWLDSRIGCRVCGLHPNHLAPFMSDILHQLSLLVSPAFTVFRSKPGARVLSINTTSFTMQAAECFAHCMDITGYLMFTPCWRLPKTRSQNVSKFPAKCQLQRWRSCRPCRQLMHTSPSTAGSKGHPLWKFLMPEPEGLCHLSPTVHHLQRKFLQPTPLPKPTWWQEPHTSPHPFSACLTYPHAERRSWQPLMVSYHSSSGFSTSWKPCPKDLN